MAGNGHVLLSARIYLHIQNHRRSRFTELSQESIIGRNKIENNREFLFYIDHSLITHLRNIATTSSSWFLPSVQFQKNTTKKKKNMLFDASDIPTAEVVDHHKIKVTIKPECARFVTYCLLWSWIGLAMFITKFWVAPILAAGSAGLNRPQEQWGCPPFNRVSTAAPLLLAALLTQ